MTAPGHGFFYYDRPNYRQQQAMDGWSKVFDSLIGLCPRSEPTRTLKQPPSPGTWRRAVSDFN